MSPEAKDYVMRQERRAFERSALADRWTFLRRMRWPRRLLAVLLLTAVVTFLLVGCGDDSSRPDPIYIVTGDMLDDARSWCFSNDGVDYFTMEDNEAEVLFCNDGRIVDGTWHHD